MADRLPTAKYGSHCSLLPLKEVSLKTGETKLYPFKVYCYNSIIKNLKDFLQRLGFQAKCELWRSRDIPEGYLADILILMDVSGKNGNMSMENLTLQHPGIMHLC